MAHPQIIPHLLGVKADSSSRPFHTFLEEHLPLQIGFYTPDASKWKRENRERRILGHQI